MTKQKKIHLLTGGNVGDRFGKLLEAKRLIHQNIGPVLQTSSIFETEAWGKVNQAPYLNQALEVGTLLSPPEVLAEIFKIEKALGRLRRSKWEARPIDIDILFFEDEIVDTADLKIPHPLLHRRNFVLIPMLQIAPLKVHPLLQKNIEELYLESQDESEVMMLESQPHES
ncbi:MAG: 2-amino-4-hydroxy-6-hydroxymethyldihydropteridine diphosphokinase [Saprospiraceae bacterium]|nr:MAG: 2-amino-4-hydroxy-6-hydroxymethyldihydropteridine diphosphokinase [Saprospiraceae bacterium]